jgi:hypothetical protein
MLFFFSALKRYMTCHAIYWHKARTKSKDIGGSDGLTGGCVGQRFKCPFLNVLMVFILSPAYEVTAACMLQSLLSASKHLVELWYLVLCYLIITISDIKHAMKETVNYQLIMWLILLLDHREKSIRHKTDSLTNISFDIIQVHKCIL